MTTYPRALVLPFPDEAIDPKGDQRTACTIAVMTALVHECKLSKRAARLNRVILDECGMQPSYTHYLNNLYDALRRWVRFEPDPKGVELIRHPEWMMQDILTRGSTVARSRFAAGGDCDDLATLGCALIHAQDMRAYFVTVANRPAPEDVFCHVFFGAEVMGRKISMDPQEGFIPGTFPPNTTRGQFWRV